MKDGCNWGHSELDARQRWPHVLAVANGPRVIAASGTTVVDAVVPSLFANATQQLAPAHGSLSLTYESVDRYARALPSVLGSH